MNYLRKKCIIFKWQKIMFICNNKPLLFNSILYIHFPKSFFVFGCARALFLRVGFLCCSKQGLLFYCSVWVSHYGGFSCCGTWALGPWASTVLMHGLSYPMAFGIFPDQRLNLCPLLWQVDSQPPGKSRMLIFLSYNFTEFID